MTKFLNKHHEYLHNKISKEIKNKPRQCEICKKIETIDNLMLAYDNEKIMCDECEFDYYDNEEQKGGV